MTNPNHQQRAQHNWLLCGRRCCPTIFSFAVRPSRWSMPALMARVKEAIETRSAQLMKALVFEPHQSAAAPLEIERACFFLPARQALGARVIGLPLTVSIGGAAKAGTRRFGSPKVTCSKAQKDEPSLYEPRSLRIACPRQSPQGCQTAEFGAFRDLLALALVAPARFASCLLTLWGWRSGSWAHAAIPSAAL